MNKMKPAILILEDGRKFLGTGFGAQGETAGEVCFNTGMTGYQEILTDPSYSGQIVTMTYPHVGNYGVNMSDVESSRIHVSGFVIREENSVPSNFRSTQSIGDYLRSEGIVGIQGVDSRALTRHIRNHGAMNGIISTVDLEERSLRKKLAEVPAMVGRDLVSKVTCGRQYRWNGDSSSSSNDLHVAAIDYGIKRNILRLLSLNGCRVTVFPGKSNPEDIMETGPDGVFLSNGPGDPAAVPYAVNCIRKLLGNVPLFGICLGHQLLALSLGAKTYKLKFGHHGTNHPVKNVSENRVEITSHNHGFSVDPDSVPSGADITHWNLNDNTVEGLRSRDIPAFSVQYHPEAGPGPHDSHYLFQQFTDLMKAEK